MPCTTIIQNDECGTNKGKTSGAFCETDGTNFWSSTVAGTCTDKNSGTCDNYTTNIAAAGCGVCGSFDPAMNCWTDGMCGGGACTGTPELSGGVKEYGTFCLLSAILLSCIFLTVRSHGNRPKFFILVPILFEYVLLRIFTRGILGIKLGFSFGTDYDFVPQFIIAFGILGWVFFSSNEKPVRLSLQPRWLILNALLFSSFILLSIGFRSFVSYQHGTFMIFWFMLAGLTLVSSLFLFLPATYFVQHPRRWLIVPAVIVGGSGIIAKTLFNFAWEPLARLTGIATHSLLNLIHFPVNYELRHLRLPQRIDEYTALIDSSHSITIGRGCGGMEGISFFVFVLGLLFLVNRKRFSLYQWTKLCFSGIFYMFFLNIVRLTLFFLISGWVEKTWGDSVGARTATMLFHNSMGWVLNSAGLFIFFGLSFRKSSIEVVDAFRLSIHSRIRSFFLSSSTKY